MENVNFVLCGLGGQGVLFMTKVLAQTALQKGIRVLCAETHGMAQRGGSVISHLRLGEAENSLVRAGTAHYLLALEENEAYRNMAFLAEGGKVYTDAPENAFPVPKVRQYFEKLKIIPRFIQAASMAMELGSPMSSNLALIGFFSSFGEGPLNYQEIRETIDQISPERFKENNLKVFDAGYEKGTGTSNS